MLHRCLVLSLVVGSTLLAGSAHADCPDGWFCDDARDPNSPGPDAPPAGAPDDRRPEPPPAADQRAFEPGDGERIDLDEPPPAPPRKRRRHKEFGVSVHSNLALFGQDDGVHDSAMAGAGAAFRIRPFPNFAVDLGLDFLGGNDWNGNPRSERAFVANAVVFANPHDPVQIYGVGGFSAGSATVDVRSLGDERVDAYETTYAYLGLQIGAGLEWRASRRVAFNTDALLFVRSRNDSGRRSDPEFVDPETHLVTNDSAFGLWRAGITFYF